MPTTKPFERYLAVVAAAGCVLISVAVWLTFSQVQPMWPLPALYLLEVIVMSVAAAAASVVGGMVGEIITWATVGILAAFSILGMFSIGALYLPTTLMLMLVCVTRDVRNRLHLPLNIGVGLIAALLQAGVMLAVARLL